MKKLLIYLKEYRKECILGPLFKLLEASFELVVPLIMAEIIDRGIDLGDKGYILRMGLVLVGLAAVGFASATTAQYFAAKAAIGFSTNLRSALLKKIQTLSYSDLDDFGTSALITRMTSDVNQVQTGVNQVLRLLLRSPFVVFGAMIMAFMIDVRCALVFAAVIFFLCVAVFIIMLTTIPMHTRVQQGLDTVTNITRGNLNGVRVLRAFNHENEEIAEFVRRNSSLAKLQLHVGRISAILNPLTLIIVNIAIIALIWTGAVRVNIGSLTQGEVVALYNLISQILIELIKMTNLIIVITKSHACAGRVSKIFASESMTNAAEEVDRADSEIRLCSSNKEIGNSSIHASDAPCGSVEFKNVSFTYHNASEAAIENISFAVAPGETCGIIGGTGSGKSTLVNLIPGFYAATKGIVLVDGINVAEFNSAELRKRIGVVPQKAVLFSGTIRSNLLIGNENATDEELKTALEIAQGWEIVQSKPLGLDEPIEQGGSNLSGGQKQRLTIARALVKKPEILILDDSASALDYATDARLRTAVRRIENSPTTFIVSQRAASIRHADKIIVMDDGFVVGMGTHDELIQSCSIYREIYNSQFKD